MKKSSYTRSVVRHKPRLAVVPRLRDEHGFFNLRALIGFTLCFAGVALALFAHFSPVTDHLSLPGAAKTSRPLPYMPAPGGRPEAMAGEGRVNAGAVDPITTVNGTIVAYLGSVGGGVWKTTNCCSNTTTWSAVTDDPLISTTAVDSVTIDPRDHNTVYAGTVDLNFGSFSMGSQGILKSTDAGATWTV